MTTKFDDATWVMGQLKAGGFTSDDMLAALQRGRDQKQLEANSIEHREQDLLRRFEAVVKERDAADARAFEDRQTRDSVIRDHDVLKSQLATLAGTLNEVVKERDTYKESSEHRAKLVEEAIDQRDAARAQIKQAETERDEAQRKAQDYERYMREAHEERDEAYRRIGSLDQGQGAMITDLDARLRSLVTALHNWCSKPGGFGSLKDLATALSSLLDDGEPRVFTPEYLLGKVWEAIPEALHTRGCFYAHEQVATLVQRIADLGSELDKAKGELNRAHIRLNRAYPTVMAGSPDLCARIDMLVDRSTSTYLRDELVRVQRELERVKLELDSVKSRDVNAHNNVAAHEVLNNAGVGNIHADVQARVAVLVAERDQLRLEKREFSDTLDCVSRLLGGAGIDLKPKIQDSVGILINQRNSYKAALHCISLSSTDSGTTREDCGREARAAIRSVAASPTGKRADG